MSTKYIASNWRLPNKAGVDSYLNDNYGLFFDIGQYIDIAASTVFDFNTNNFSVSCWVKKGASSSGNYQPIFDFGGYSQSPYNQGTNIYSNNSNQIHIYNRGSSPSNWLTSITTSTGWNNIVVVRNGDNLTVYINNSTEQVNQTFTGVSSINFGGTAISRIGGSNSWQGDISEVSVFDYALSSTQISTLYGSSSLGAGNPMALKPAPVAFYPLGDNSSGDPITQPNEAVEDASVFDFDGISQFINAGNTTYLNGVTEMTLSIWFNLDVAAQNKGLISDRQSTGGNGHFSIATKGISGNGYSFRLYLSRSDGVEASIQISNQPFTAGQWHNLIMTFNAGTVIFYADGSLAPSAIYRANNGIPSTLGSTAESLDIGKYLTLEWDGLITNVALWNSDQTSEISNIYNSGVPATSYTNTPTAWYKLDQSANWEADSTGAWQIPDAVSAYPQSFSFDGNNDFVELSSPLNLTNKSFSLETWIKWDGAASRRSLFGHLEANATKKNIHWRIYPNGMLRFDFYNSSIDSSVGAIEADTWNHLSITYDYDTSTCICYKNGQELMQGTIGPYIGSVSNSSTFLGCMNNGIEAFPGKMSSFRQYDVVLSSTQVETLYNNGTPLTTAIASDNLKAWYKLDNTATFSTNWSIPDASGNGNTGTSSGMTEQNLVNNNVSALNGESSGMTSANLVLTDLTRNLPFDSYSFNFDSASSDYIDLGNNANLYPATSDMSYSFWFKFVTGSSYRTIFGQGATDINALSTGNKAIFITVFGDELRVFVAFGQSGSWAIDNGGAFNTSNANFVNNEWYHIVFTFDRDGDGIIYVNGFPNVTQAVNGSSTSVDITSTDITTIASPTLGYNSQISNVSIFDEALTSTEVMKLYSNGMPQDLSSFTPAPVAWWPLGSNSFWNGSQWTVRDMIGSNDGTGVNLGQDALVGDSPRSEANGTGTNMDIPTNLEGSTKWSENNSWSINMSESARVADTP